jgi:hypothetical protein
MVATLRRPIGGLEIIRPDRWIPDELKAQMHDWEPKSRMGQIVKECLKYLPPDLAAEVVERITSCLVVESSLAIKVIRQPDSPFRLGRDLIEDHGITSRKIVTTAGVTALAVAWANATYAANFMALGTGSGAEAIGDTALTEITSTHYTGSVRVTCTHAESTNTVPIVGTHTQATAGDTIAEHGIFTSNTPAAAGLWDRSLTGTIVLAVADSLQGTYTLTLSSGG